MSEQQGMGTVTRNTNINKGKGLKAKLLHGDRNKGATWRRNKENASENG